MDEIQITHPESVTHRLLIAQAVNELIRGRGNNVGSFTLTANQATTTVEDNLFFISQVPVWVPTTANGAAALANMYISARDNGSFTITHANNAQTDRDFLYIRAG